MALSLSEQADFCRIALGLGIISRTDVVYWVDRIIAEREEPPSTLLIALSLGGQVRVSEFEDLLQNLAGGTDLPRTEHARAAHAILGCLAAMLDRNELELTDLPNLLKKYNFLTQVEADKVFDLLSWWEIWRSPETHDNNADEWITADLVRWAPRPLADTPLEEMRRFLLRYATSAQDAPVCNFRPFGN